MSRAFAITLLIVLSCASAHAQSFMDAFNTREQVKFIADIKVMSAEDGKLGVLVDLAPADGLVDYVFVYHDAGSFRYSESYLVNCSGKWDGKRLIINHPDGTIDVAAFQHNDLQGLNLSDPRVFFKQDGVGISLSDYRFSAEERSMVANEMKPMASTCGSAGQPADCDSGGAGASSCQAGGCAWAPTSCGVSCNTGYYACCGCLTPPPCTAPLGCFGSMDMYRRSSCHCCSNH